MSAVRIPTWPEYFWPGTGPKSAVSRWKNNTNLRVSWLYSICAKELSHVCSCEDSMHMFSHRRFHTFASICAETPRRQSGQRIYVPTTNAWHHAQHLAPAGERSTSEVPRRRFLYDVYGKLPYEAGLTAPWGAPYDRGLRWRWRLRTACPECLPVATKGGHSLSSSHEQQLPLSEPHSMPSSPAAHGLERQARGR